MLVVMQSHATDEQVRDVCKKIESLGYRAHPMPGEQRTAIGITGNAGVVEPGTLDEMPGVQELIRVSKPLQAGQPRCEARQHGHHFSGSDATIGGHTLAIMAKHPRMRTTRNRRNLFKAAGNHWLTGWAWAAPPPTRPTTGAICRTCAIKSVKLVGIERLRAIRQHDRDPQCTSTIKPSAPLPHPPAIARYLVPLSSSVAGSTMMGRCCVSAQLEQC